MWLIYDVETGAEVSRSATEPDNLPAHQSARLMPESALMVEPITVWSPAARGFVDVPLVDGPTMLRLLTGPEIVAACSNPATVPIVLNWLVLVAGGRPQRVNSSLHIAAAASLQAAGVLTPERHAEFLAGIPPSEGGN